MFEYILNSKGQVIPINLLKGPCRPWGPRTKFSMHARKFWKKFATPSSELIASSQNEGVTLRACLERPRRALNRVFLVSVFFYSFVSAAGRKGSGPPSPWLEAKLVWFSVSLFHGSIWSAPSPPRSPLKGSLFEVF